LSSNLRGFESLRLTIPRSTVILVEPQTPEFEKSLQDLSRQNTKLLIQKLYAMKAKKLETFDEQEDEYKIYDYSKTEYDIELPDSTTVFPRQKKLPDAKILTRWEKFAKDKGIQKKRRGRMVYDEATGDWVPRWGAGSQKNIQKQMDIIREAKPGENPKDDPFDKSSMKRKLHSEKQKYREMRNKMESQGLNIRDLPTGVAHVNKKKKDKKTTSKLLEIAQKSTASMGLFDKKAHKEEPKIVKKRKNTVPGFKNAEEEKRRNLDILDYVAKTKAQK